MWHQLETACSECLVYGGLKVIHRLVADLAMRKDRAVAGRILEVIPQELKPGSLPHLRRIDIRMRKG